MLYTLLGFLLGIVLFILNFVLRIALKTLSVTLDRLAKSLGMEQANDTARKIGNTVKKTAEVGAKTVRAGVKTAKLGIKAAILGVKALIALIKLILAFIKVLVVLATCTAFWVIILIIFLVIALVVVAVCVSSMGSMTDSKQSGYSQSMSTTSYNYMDVDWSQDFSAKLDVIEGTYGKVDRDWVELAIISMNTQQNQDDIEVPVQGYTIGIVAIESGGNDFMQASEGHPMTAYALKNTSEGLLWETGGNPASADGLFQITNSGWCKWNTLYEEMQGEMSPVLNESTAWFTQRYYIPSAVYGQLSRYTSAIAGDSYGFTGEGKTSIERAFEYLGIEPTSGKLAYVKNACLASYAYGGLVDDCCAEGSKSDLATNIAMFVAMYCETYMSYNSAGDTYEYSELSTKLSDSIVSTLGSSFDIGISNSSIMSSVYGTSEKSTFSESMKMSANLGVLDASGTSINQTIDGYLYSLMPSTAQEFFDSTCSDTMDVMSNTKYTARCYYDISMLIASNYILEKVINALGLKTSALDGDWMHAVDEMGQWYASNIDSYCQQTGSKSWLEPSTEGGRQWFYCDLINGTVGNDCSSYVTAVCGYYGAVPDFKGGWAYTSSNFRSDSGKPLVGQLINSGFNYYSGTSAYEPQAGDIRISDGHIEIVAGVVNGKVFAYTWGKNCGVSNPNGGEPQEKYSVANYASSTVSYWRLEK